MLQNTDQNEDESGTSNKAWTPQCIWKMEGCTKETMLLATAVIIEVSESSVSIYNVLEMNFSYLTGIGNKISISQNFHIAIWYT
jgi:hypothetical protein